jgi:hypothetical protein
LVERYERIRNGGVDPREDNANSVAILDFPNWFWIVGLGLSLRGNCG